MEKGEVRAMFLETGGVTDEMMRLAIKAYFDREDKSARIFNRDADKAVMG